MPNENEKDKAKIEDVGPENETPTKNTASTSDAVAFNSTDLSFMDNNPPEINAVSAKINMPPFDKRNIDGWFLSLDYWFPAMGIKSDTQKFNTVMAALDSRMLQDFLSFVGRTPDTGKYEFVRRRLTSFCTDSQPRRLNQAFESTLGDMKPSQLYSEMSRLVGDSMTESAVKNLWMKRLPIYAQAAVAASTGPPSEYLRIADAIVETITLQVNSCSEEGAAYVALPVQYTPPTSTSISTPPKSEYSELCSTINELTKRFDKMWSDRGRQTKRSNSRHGRQDRSRSKTPANSDECWYHRKYGSESRRCRAPCKHFKGPSNGNNQH